MNLVRTLALSLSIFSSCMSQGALKPVTLCSAELAAAFDPSHPEATGVAILKDALVLSEEEVRILRVLLERAFHGPYSLVTLINGHGNGLPEATAQEQFESLRGVDLSAKTSLHRKLLRYAATILAQTRALAPKELHLVVYLDLYMEKSLFVPAMHVHDGEHFNWFIATTAFRSPEGDSDAVGTMYQLDNATGQARHGETLLFTDMGRESYYRSAPDALKFGTRATPHCSAPGSRVVVRAIVHTVN